MFESAEIGHKIDKETFDLEIASLREALLEAQYELKQQVRFPVIILINGIEGAGKGETVKRLNEWMDPRLIQVSTFDFQTDEELARPPAWRFWRQLPGKGKIGIFFGNWYTQMLQGRVHKHIKNSVLDQAIDRALTLEQMLCEEGALIFKFWFHLSKSEMKKRLKDLKNDPLHSWRISPLDWQQSKTYDRFVKYGEHILQRSNRDFAPWYIIEGVDQNYRELSAGRIILNGLQAALSAETRPTTHPHVAPLATPIDNLSLLSQLDLSVAIDKDQYQQQLALEQARLSTLMRHPQMKDRALVTVFEGNDAAGKGGAIRRVTGALDPRQYRIVSIGAPTDEERLQPYLWRFWRFIPAKGKFTIFDRSWYGRVMVERVEGFCSPGDWLRAYNEINDFEEQLTESGIILVKCWLAIDQQTQLQRFQERERVPFKRFKITEEDWRNREKWDEYCTAVNDMVDRTSSSYAPWTLIEANNKHYARIKVLKTINDKLQSALDS